MINLEQVPNTTEWGAASSVINQNNQKIAIEIESTKGLVSKFRGYYTTEALLRASVPAPLAGDTAYVGATYPGTVYDVVNGDWHNTGVAPNAPTVDLTNYVNRDGSQTITGQKTFTSPIAGVNAVGDNQLPTWGQVKGLATAPIVVDNTDYPDVFTNI